MRIWKIKYFLLTITDRITNYFLVQKYPWLRPITWATNEKGEYIEIRDPNYHYERINIFNNIPGWWKAFGKIFCDEIQEHYDECPNMYILETKEKYGALRISFCYSNEAIDRICDKYEHISQNICYFCGREAPMTNAGWLLPICPYCYKKEKWANKPYKDVVCKGDTGKMRETYTIRQSSEGGSKDTIYDISDTVKKIRAKCAKNR